MASRWTRWRVRPSVPTFHAPPGFWRPWLALSLLVIGLVGLVAFNRWWVARYTAPWEFLLPWAGLRGWLFEGRSPYDPTWPTTLKALWPQAAGTPQALPQPLWAMAFYFPWALIPEPTLAYALWITVQQGLLLAWVWAWTAYRPRQPSTRGLVLLLALAWPATWMAWRTGRPTLAVVAAMSLAWTSFLDGREQRTGALLMALWLDLAAFAWPFVAWFMWALARGRREGPMTWLVASLGLVGLVGWLRPSWWQEYWLALAAALPGQPIEGPALARALVTVFPGLGARVGLAAVAAVLVWMLIQWGRAWVATTRLAFWTWHWTLAVTPWLGWRVTDDALLALLPGLLLPTVLWMRRRAPWQPVLLTLTLALWGLGWALLGRTDTVRSWDLALLVLVPLALMALGWARWWLLRLSPPWME